MCAYMYMYRHNVHVHVGGTWLSERGYSLHHVDAVNLSRNNEAQPLEGLCVDNKGVAPGR